MEEIEKVYLVLGCFGHKQDDFVMCPSTENRILKVDESLYGFDEIWAYLESVRLLDRPMLDINAIRHLVHNLQQNHYQNTKKIWTESKFNLIERFIINHKSCGLYAKLIVTMDEPNHCGPKKQEEERVFIKGIEKKEYPVYFNKPMRSRRLQ